MDHISKPMRSATATVACACIRRAEQSGDMVKAQRLRKIWDDWVREAVPPDVQPGMKADVICPRKPQNR